MTRPTAIAYRPTDGAVDLDVRLLADVRPVVPEGLVERVQFHMLVAVTEGSGTHMVDFETVRLEVGDVLWVRPGQIQRWSHDWGFEAVLALFTEGPPTGGAGGPLTLRPTPHDFDQLVALLQLALLERSRRRPDDAARTAQRALRDLVLVTVGGADQTPPPARDSAHRAFVADLEADLDIRTSIDTRAARVGYSTRTVTRACRSATGASPKQITDERLGLEARRLLSLPGATVGGVARTLGFRDDSNFVTWFRRLHGVTPGAWRA